MKFSKKLYPLLSFCVLLLFSCGNNPDDQIKNLNGYWEISEVEKNNKTVKEYSVSTLIDYIEINEEKGFRKKVAPKFDGSFETTDDQQNIETEIINGKVLLHYSTAHDQWTETVLEATKKELRVLTEDEFVYIYKRYEKMDLGI